MLLRGRSYLRGGSWNVIFGVARIPLSMISSTGRRCSSYYARRRSFGLAFTSTSQVSETAAFATGPAFHCSIPLFVAVPRFQKC
jgi:hypothetical protein